MAERFFALSEADRHEALEYASDRSGRPIQLLDKDTWVVWALSTLYDHPIGQQLVFKGGTSLSKAYGAIRRFSEDIDLTYDIRAIAPDLAGAESEPLPTTRSQQGRWTREIRQRLPEWIDSTVVPILKRALDEQRMLAAVIREDDKIYLQYDPVAAGSVYVAPTVQLEFGARSTGEPASPRLIVCDAAGLVEGVAFPSATARVMHAERTFWEKATAIHVYCLQGRQQANRYARHWHDIVRLDDAGVADLAIADRPLAEAVARHKAMFFAAKAADRTHINYRAAVSGNLQLVPTGAAAFALSRDYLQMVDNGLLLDDAEPFDTLMARCAELEQRINRAADAAGARRTTRM